MAWNEQLENRWSRHSFDERWELLTASPDPAGFLQSLDLFVYEPGPNCRESWGRVVVEAMLTGAIPLVPRGGGHHLENLIAHGKSGFVCRHRDDFARYARYLQDCTSARLRISRQGRARAMRHLCNRRSHLKVWSEVFQGC
jgi:glycosyltransferase involved in cell wall biosynthesis